MKATFSPITRRRLANFRGNTRGFTSFCIFLLILAIVLPAEFVANDKPIILKLKGTWYFPVIRIYSEVDFGGDFETEADYKDPFVAEDLIETEGGWMLWPPIPWSYDTIDEKDDAPAPAPPSRRHLLGTDDHGRDVVARAIYGFRISVLFGFTLTAISTVIGMLLGLWQGFSGGWVDLLFQRFMELWGSMPRLYLLIIMSSFIQPGFFNLLGLMLLFSWMAMVGMVRAETLKARNYDYVRAARALGMSGPRIAIQHVLPNALTAALSLLPFVLAGSLGTLTSLDYLGLGLPPGSPSLGEMLQQGKANMHAPWLGLVAFSTTAIMLCLVVFIGEAVRDAWDPRKTVQD